MHLIHCMGMVLGSSPESEDISLASHTHNLQMHSQQALHSIGSGGQEKQTLKGLGMFRLL